MALSAAPVRTQPPPGAPAQSISFSLAVLGFVSLRDEKDGICQVISYGERNLSPCGSSPTPGISHTRNQPEFQPIEQHYFIYDLNS